MKVHIFAVGVLLAVSCSLPTISKAATVVTVTQESNGWVLRVDGQPFIIKGVSYSPDKVGQDPFFGTLQDWMIVDENENSLIDAPEEGFWDKNKNNLQDPDEPSVGDFQFLRSMGVNTIRVYHHASDDPSVIAGYGFIPGIHLLYNHPPNIQLLRDLYNNYGIRVLMGDALGALSIGSGAPSLETNYNDNTQKNRMRASVQQMVNDFKDEDFLLGWVLGNENYDFELSNTNADLIPTVYADFLEEIAQMIKAMDPNHPIIHANGDGLFLNELAQNAPSVDIYGANVYRGTGFGDFFQEISSVFNKPVLLTEYGDFEGIVANLVLDEDKQSATHETNWLEIMNNAAGGPGSDNSIGGVAFSWMDLWWFTTDPDNHNADTDNTQDEFTGIASQGDGSLSPFLKQFRKLYWTYRDLWRERGGTYVWTHAAQDGQAFSAHNWDQNKTPAPGSIIVFDGNSSNDDCNFDYPVELAGIQVINGYTGTVTMNDGVTILQGDYDQDGDVDGKDFLIWQRDPSISDLNLWESTFGNDVNHPQIIWPLSPADVDQDGDVDGDDFLKWQQNPHFDLAIWERDFGRLPGVPESVEPASAENSGSVEIKVTGSGFQTDSLVALRLGDDEPIIAHSVHATPTLVKAKFDIYGHNAGEYHVTVFPAFLKSPDSNLRLTATIPNAFKIMDANSVAVSANQYQGILIPDGSAYIMGNENGIVSSNHGEGLTFVCNPSEAGQVEIVIYTMDGREVKRFSNTVSGNADGFHWDLRNSAGQPLASGTYVAKIRGAGLNNTRKIIVAN